MTLDKYKASTPKTPTNSKVMDELAKKRTRCEIYTRVMGYFRPVSQFNIWKKSEFYSRTYFKQESPNKEFCKQYS